jgi:hypothetical protein
VAQWKRAGPITQRSVDRNHALLRFFPPFCAALLNVNTKVSVSKVSRSVSVVVITSALHAEGRQFDPGTDQLYFVQCGKHVRMAEWSKAPDSRLVCLVP